MTKFRHVILMYWHPIQRISALYYTLVFINIYYYYYYYYYYYIIII